MILSIVGALNFFIALLPTGVCSVGELRASPGYRYRVDRIRQFVDSAEVIVRAKALGASHDSLPFSGAAPAWVRFEVLERLRGPDSLTQLNLRGFLVPRDDFNDGTVPYTMVRSSGQRGDCYAREYQAGAEYLLILRAGGVGLSPQWKPLAPFNEQVRGVDDPWVVWVRTVAGRGTT